MQTPECHPLPESLLWLPSGFSLKSFSFPRPCTSNLISTPHHPLCPPFYSSSRHPILFTRLLHLLSPLFGMLSPNIFMGRLLLILQVKCQLPAEPLFDYPGRSDPPPPVSIPPSQFLFFSALKVPKVVYLLTCLLCFGLWNNFFRFCRAWH